MSDLCECLRQGIDVRANLIEARRRLKEAGESREGEAFCEELAADSGLLEGFLTHGDPKVRKNAALLIGDLGLQALAEQVFLSYMAEETLFIRGDYLKTLQRLDCGNLVEPLERQLSQMQGKEVPAEEKKHFREELAELQKLLLSYQTIEKHSFLGLGRRFDIVLTTNHLHREVTAESLKGSTCAVMPLGVKVYQADLREILRIRTFRELLFALDIAEVSGEPEQAAAELAESNLLMLLEKMFYQELGEEQPAGKEKFYFRITVAGSMPLNKRSDFVRKCSFELEQCTDGMLINTASDYEVELRLYQRRDGSFFPLVKAMRLPDRRFSYRKEYVAASIRPSQAALIAYLAKPWMKEGAQVLDPFCGVGTMLIERDKAVKAENMYGVDIFGEAIRKAWGNAARAKREIYFITRDFFDFTHKYQFDEIITNMPVRGKKSRQEQEELYQRFFDKALELLTEQGTMILYSNEKGYVKKQLRLRKGLKLQAEYTLNEKEDFCLFVITVQP